MTFDDGYHSVLENAFPTLRERGIPSTMFVPHSTSATDLAGSPISGTGTHPSLMTPDELREMQKHGTLIGSHGMTHRALTRISQAEMAAELADSRKRSRTCWTNALTSSRCHERGTRTSTTQRLHQGAQIFLNVPVRQNGTSSASSAASSLALPTSRWSIDRSAAGNQWMPWAMAAKRRLVSVLRQFLPTTSGR